MHAIHGKIGEFKHGRYSVRKPMTATYSMHQFLLHNEIKSDRHARKQAGMRCQKDNGGYFTLLGKRQSRAILKDS